MQLLNAEIDKTFNMANRSIFVFSMHPFSQEHG